MVKNPGNGRLNNLNDPSRPQCVNVITHVQKAFYSRPLAQERIQRIETIRKYYCMQDVLIEFYIRGASQMF